MVRDSAVQAIYAEADDNRQLQAGSVKTDDLTRMRQEWRDEAALVAARPSLAVVARDAKCYDAVMWWVHHVTAAAKKELISAGHLTRLPLMPVPDLPHSQGAIAAKDEATAAAVPPRRLEPRPISTRRNGQRLEPCPVWTR
jgi:hypothetical protein